jgi:hypothetical protein
MRYVWKEKYVLYILIQFTDQIGLFSSNVLDLYLGVVWFKSQPGHQLSWLKFFFLHSFQAHARIVPWVGHDCFLPNPFQLIIHQWTYCSMLCSLRFWKSCEVNHKKKLVQVLMYSLHCSFTITENWITLQVNVMIYWNT